MATTSWSDALGHRDSGIDVFDYVLAFALITALPAFVGIGSFTLFSYSMSEVLWSGSSAEVTIATVLTSGALSFAWVSNQADGIDDFDRIETGAIAGGIITVVGIAFIPAVSDLVLGSDIWGAIAAAVLYGAYTVLAYK